MTHDVTATDQVFTGLEGRTWHALDRNYGRRLAWDEAYKHLDWKVGRIPVELNGRKSKKWFYTVGEDLYRPESEGPEGLPVGVLGVVGSGYRVIQNEQLWKFFEPVVGKGEAIFETGGSIQGGHKVRVLARLPQYAFEPAKNDLVELYVLIANSHDGSIRWLATFTNVRVVWRNTLHLALSPLKLSTRSTEDDGGDSESGQTFITIRHTAKAEFQIEQAHRALGLATRNGAEMQVVFARLANAAMTALDFKEYVKFLFPSAPEKRGEEPSKQIKELREKLEAQFDAEINNLDPDRKHTAWSAYNAVTDHIDHAQPKKGSTDRQDYSWFGLGAQLRFRALNWLVKRFVK